MGKKLTGRERVRLALNHREPDQVPMDLWLTMDSYVALRRELGLPSRVSKPWDWQNTPGAVRPGATTWSTDARVELDVVEKLDLDVIRRSGYPPNNGRGFVHRPEDDLYIDEWGVPHHRAEFETGYGGAHFEIRIYPMAEATIKDIGDYPWPNPRDPSFLGDLPDDIPRIYKETPYAILGQFGRGGIYEQAKYLRGFEQLFIDMAVDQEFVHALFQKLLEIELEFNRVGIEAVGKYLSILRLSPEDLGTQTSLLVSPQIHEDVVRPYYKRRFHEVRRMLNDVGNHECKIMYHSCGAIRPLLPGLVDDGMEVLDPLQPLEVDDGRPARFKEAFGDRISFLGGINVQSTLPRGTPEDVRDEVRQRIKEMAAGGGFILSSAHRMLPDIPFRNIKAMYEAGREYGRYPISL
jgi:uroporphyrinogen decarboxylase